MLHSLRSYIKRVKGDSIILYRKYDMIELPSVRCRLSHMGKDFGGAGVQAEPVEMERRLGTSESKR